MSRRRIWDQWPTQHRTVDDTIGDDPEIHERVKYPTVKHKNIIFKTSGMTYYYNIDNNSLFLRTYSAGLMNIFDSFLNVLFRDFIITATCWWELMKNLTQASKTKIELFGSLYTEVYHASPGWVLPDSSCRIESQFSFFCLGQVPYIVWNDQFTTSVSWKWLNAQHFNNILI